MKKALKNFWVFIPLVLAAMMFFILPHFPDVTEYAFSRVWFKVMTVPLGFITSLVPISLTELLVILAAPLVIALIALLVVKLIRHRKPRGKILLGAGRFVAGVVSTAAFAYMSCHGVNYYRQPIEKAMGLDTSEKTAEDLYSACVILAKGAAEARAELEEQGLSGDEPYRFTESVYTELARAGAGYDGLVKEHPFLWTSVSRQKPVIQSEQWAYTGITGMYFPMFAECNVNTAQPDFEIPFTAAHESAHSRGIAFENECNFLAFLSCINSPYPEYRYSGYMNAFMYCSNDLYDYDREIWQDTQQYLTEGMFLDFREHNKYIDDHRGKVQEVSHEINNSFITSQGVSDGVLSYDRVTELILAYYAQNG